MKRATKIAGLVVATAVCVTSMSVLVACGDDPADTTKNEYTVTYYDGTKELKKETVKEGEKATRWKIILSSTGTRRLILRINSILTRP